MTLHACVRAKERYGLQVGKEDFEAISRQIADGIALKLGRKRRRTSVYLVTVQGTDAVVVYNRRSKCVITFLPLDWTK
jgi:hypothetical protein